MKYFIVDENKLKELISDSIMFQYFSNTNITLNDLTEYAHECTYEEPCQGFDDVLKQELKQFHELSLDLEDYEI